MPGGVTVTRESLELVFLVRIQAGQPLIIKCEDGGTGRHASLRGWWAQALGGSTPPPRTIINTGPHRLARPRTSDSHSEDRGSNPRGGAIYLPILAG